MLELLLSLLGLTSGNEGDLVGGPRPPDPPKP
jgi:hypothetical protein